MLYHWSTEGLHLCIPMQHPLREICHNTDQGCTQLMWNYPMWAGNSTSTWNKLDSLGLPWAPFFSSMELAKAWSCPLILERMQLHRLKLSRRVRKSRALWCGEDAPYRPHRAAQSASADWPVCPWKEATPNQVPVSMCIQCTYGIYFIHVYMFQAKKKNDSEYL